MIIQNKTAPRLLDDILNNDEAFPSYGIFNQAPSSPSCSHTYVTNHDRSHLPALDERPVSGTVWNVGAYCTHCRNHIDLILKFSQTDFACPNHEYPVHLFRVLPKPFEEGGLEGDFRFECTSPTCRAILGVRIRPPVLNLDDVYYFTDRTAIKKRMMAVAEEYVDWQEKPPGYVLRTFRTYIEDALKSQEEKKIPTANKVFKACLGKGATGILKRLGFVYQGSYWILPRPPPHWESSPDSLRARLEDVRDELTNLLRSLPAEDRGNATDMAYEAPPSTVRDMERMLGSLDYEKTQLFKLRSQQTLASTETQMPYRGLGAKPDFADELIAWTFDRQIFLDPMNASFNFQCLKEIAETRQSEELATKAMILESQGFKSRKDVTEAYRYLGVDPSHAFLKDEHILGKFQSRLSDVAASEQQQMKHALRLVADDRNSDYLRHAITDSVENYEQALAWLGADESTPDEFIWSLVTLKVDDDKASETAARKAVEIIAKHRNSNLLQSQISGTAPPKPAMDLKEAFVSLGCGDNYDVSDDLLFDSFTTSLNEGGPKDELRQALLIIATHRNSEFLKLAADSEESAPSYGPPPPPPKNDQNEPRGLRNIGNTCYLNSILQCVFTVTPIRSLAANIETIGENFPLPVEGKRVGNIRVNPAQVMRAQKFVAELQKLFYALVTVRVPDVTPEKSLARLTTEPIDFQRARRRSTVSGPAGTVLRTISHNSESRAEASPTSPVFESVAELTEPVDEGLSFNQDINLGETSQPLQGVSKGQGKTASISTDGEHNLHPMTLDNTSQNTLVADNEDQIMQEPDAEPSEEAVPSKPSPSVQPPPVPPRPQKDDSVKVIEEYTMQQDVNEVLANVFEQLRWAVKGEQTEADGEQVDIISRLFYGKCKQIHVDGGKMESKIETFMDIVLYLPDETQDLYTAIDHSLDLNKVDTGTDQEEGAEKFSYTMIKELPPIVSFSTSRSQFDVKTQTGFKNSNQLRLEERIVLDRYMEDDDMLEKRKASWALRAELDQLRRRKVTLTETDIGLTMPVTLKSTSTYIESLQQSAEDLGLDPSLLSDTLIRGLEDLSTELSDEIKRIDSRIGYLERQRSSIFDDTNGSLAYRLHAVFVHRGRSAGSGHWFLHMKDHKNGVWRTYNDETVLQTRDIRVVFEPNSTTDGTSAFVMYVKEELIPELIDTVHREPEPEPEPPKPTFVYEGASSSRVSPPLGEWDIERQHDLSHDW